MKNLLLIAFATLALSMGANIANACPACEGKTTVKAEKKADKAEVKKTDKAATDVNTDAVADVKETKTDKACTGCSHNKRASAGQLVKADRDTAGTCKKACEGCGSGCGGCGGAMEPATAKKDCGEGCGEGCGSAKKAEKVVKN